MAASPGPGFAGLLSFFGIDLSLVAPLSKGELPALVLPLSIAILSMFSLILSGPFFSAQKRLQNYALFLS